MNWSENGTKGGILERVVGENGTITATFAFLSVLNFRYLFYLGCPHHQKSVT